MVRDAKLLVMSLQLKFPLHSVFVALPLENSTQEQFRNLQQELGDFSDILRFQNPVSPHLTLQFWKEVMEIEYYQIVPQSKRIADATAPFSLKIQGVSTFGSHGEDRILYLNVPFSEELARLKKRCPWPSLEPFSPHITIARIKHPQRFAIVRKKVMKLVQDVEFEMEVDRVRLYAEIAGVKQTALHDFAFVHNGG